MPGMLYFVPTDRENLSLEELAGAGLAHALEKSAARCRAAKGPGGGPGLVVVPACPGGEAPRAGYYSDSQLWEEGPKDGEGNVRWWLGCEKDARPGPDDLARSEQFGGHKVRLADGSDWLVPVARHVGGETPFPRALSLVEGRWEPGRVKARFGWLWEQAARIWDALGQVEGATEVSFEDEVGIAVEALALNYRLGPHEVSFLELLDTRVEAEVVLALIDWPSVVEIQKKIQRGEISTEPGGKD